MNQVIELPAVEKRGSVSVEEALSRRASVRQYSTENLELSEVGQLLWAAQGMTRPGGYRTAPSAGALYPLEVFLMAGRVSGLEAGTYRYLPHEHALEPMASGDKLGELSSAALSQSAVADAAAAIVIAAVFERTTVKYGDRGVSYVHNEVGAAAENVCLQVEALDLATVWIGAFEDDRVQQVVGMRETERPLCILPVGRPPD